MDETGHQGVYLDNIDEPQSNPEEEQANKKARDWLIPPDNLQEFVTKTRPKFSGKAISEFAQKKTEKTSRYYFSPATA